MTTSPQPFAAEASLVCDLLLFFATSTEQDELRAAAGDLGLSFTRKRHALLGKYFQMGAVGDFQVIAVRTEMGPLGFEGSARKALAFRQATEATAIVQLGMAFGVDPVGQQPGDVLVSSSLIPYDRRKIVAHGPGYRIDYTPAQRQPARRQLVDLFAQEGARSSLGFRVHVGAVLSGGAAIFSRKFRDDLVAGIPATGESIVGGEMEGVGLICVSPPDDPAWIVVKGISDFADEDRDAVIQQTRPLACRNSARFVLSTLKKASHL